jgi:tetratricopeptide (TPR) repeat protein
VEKDFTSTNPFVFCQVCGALNAPESLICKVCKAPIVVLSLSEKEEKLYDDFSEEAFIFDEIRAIKDGFNELKKNLDSLKEELKETRREVRTLFNGFNSIREILEERNLLKFDEVDERWKEKEENLLKLEEQLNYLLSKKDKILSKYKGKNFSAFANLIEKAKDEFAERDLKAGINFLKKALKKDPKNTELLNLLGFISLKNKNNKEANVYLKKSLSLEKNPEILFLKVWALSLEGNYKEALEILEKIKGEQFDQFLLNLMEGNLNFSLKNYEKAIISFKKALEFGENPYIRFLLFKSFDFLNKKELALEHLLKIKDVKPYREEMLYNLGKIKLFLNKNKSSLNFFKELLNEHPEKLKYQLSYLFAKERLDLKFFKESKKEIEKIEKKIDEENFEEISQNFYKLYNAFPKENFYLLSYLYFDFFKKKTEENISLIENILKQKTYSFYRILGFLIYISILKKISRQKLILKVSKDFYKSSKTNLERAFSSLFISNSMDEVEKDGEKALKFAKEALILLPEELKIYGVFSYTKILYNLEKRKDVYEILKEIASKLEEEEVLVDLGRAALKEGNEKEAKEIFKNIRNFEEKPKGIVFKYWLELFKEIRSYI